MYRNLPKRLIDVAGAITVLTLFAPMLLIAAILVRARLGKPVLFRQTRPGKNGKAFTILKFRTMRGGQDAETDAERLVSVGRVLRALSVDELPELWNVLKGDMSLVGPRPLLMQYLDRYTPEQARRHELKPGVTGWAQVNGRNEVSWEKKFELDVWYVDNVSFLLDLKILAMTCWQVIVRRGINQPGHVTAQEFMGSAR